MKKLILGTMLAVSLMFTAKAQTNQTIIGGVQTIAESIGSAMPTNIAVLTYGLYSKGSKEWGGGTFLAWNFNQNVGVGMGIEAIGKSFWMPSAQVQLKLPMRPLSFIGLSNLVFTPYLNAGAAAPLGGGASGAASVASIAGGGAYIDIFKLGGGSVALAGGYNYWGGAGAQSGDHYYGGLAWHRGF